jgi:hypothetical protein
MDKISKLRRLEIVFNEDGSVGSQATFEDGYEIDSQWIKSGERTTGLNAGINAEYETTLQQVLGEALSPALARVATLEADVAEKTKALEDKDEKLGVADSKIKSLEATELMRPNNA